MGGELVTWLALDNPDISGLLLIAPAYDSKLKHYLRWSGVYSRFQPWVFGGMIHEDNPQKYNSIPVKSGWQYYQLARGLMYAPTDPLFGIAGRILFCNGNEYAVYSECMRSRQHWFGARHTLSLDGIPVARTTFNAGWEGVLTLFDQWLPHAGP